MRFLLFVLAILAFLVGAWTLVGANSAIHEIDTSFSLSGLKSR